MPLSNYYPSSVPKLPKLLYTKLSKTGKTRGADDDVIYQNRVSRNNTVLIPFSHVHKFKKEIKSSYFENGYVVLLTPEEHASVVSSELKNAGLELGKNLLVVYETRDQWINYNPSKYNWIPATERTGSLGGEYVARVPANTGSNDNIKISLGFNTTEQKGLGIRAFEYADSTTIDKCRIQLESLFWLCKDSKTAAIKHGMLDYEAAARKKFTLDLSNQLGLLNYQQLQKQRILNSKNQTICPLCLSTISGKEFFDKLQQADGRRVHDLTATDINLFHIKELRLGEYNHKPYNLGWGHHHCNIVVKDAGIEKTLKWMQRVVLQNSRKP